MLNRDKVIETLKQLPEKFTIDELIDRIILLDKIEKGIEQSQKDLVVGDEKFAMN